MSTRALKIHDLLAPSLPTRTLPEVRKAESRRHKGRLFVDRAVLTDCRAGDPDAFDTLFETTKDHVYTLALHFSGDETTAADVTQEVFLKLLEKIGQFRENAEFSTWLYRVVLNTFLDLRRSQKPWLSLEALSLARRSLGKRLSGERSVRKTSLDGPTSGAAFSKAQEDLLRELTRGATQEDDAVRGQTAFTVRRAVAELQPRWRAIVVLRYSAGLSYEEIAEVLEISPGTVASRLNRAHAKLATKLRHLRS